MLQTRTEEHREGTKVEPSRKAQNNTKSTACPSTNPSPPFLASRDPDLGGEFYKKIYERVSKEVKNEVGGEIQDLRAQMERYHGKEGEHGMMWGGLSASDEDNTGRKPPKPLMLAAHAGLCGQEEERGDYRDYRESEERTSPEELLGASKDSTLQSFSKEGETWAASPNDSEDKDARARKNGDKQVPTLPLNTEFNYVL